jgi:hypothetical protein
MVKTPPPVSLLLAVTVVAAPFVTAAADHSAAKDVHALDVRPYGAAAPDDTFSMPSADGRQEFDPGAANRAPGDLDAQAADSGALPLAQFARGEIKPPATPGPTGFRALVARVRDGGLPEPASWALMLIGFGMIGGALRGFIVANRRLAGLQPEDADTGPLETGPLETGPLETGASEG